MGAGRGSALAGPWHELTFAALLLRFWPNTQGVICALSGAVRPKQERQTIWTRGEEKEGSPSSHYALQLMTPAVLQQ